MFKFLCFLNPKASKCEISLSTLSQLEFTHSILSLESSVVSKEIWLDNSAYYANFFQLTFVSFVKTGTSIRSFYDIDKIAV